MTTPLILDLDSSVGQLHTAIRLPLGDWQELIRLGCGWQCWRRFYEHLAVKLPSAYGTVFLGSGDFHHLTHLLIKQCPVTKCDVVVCDNHPDNMLFPLGIHCGSWVKHVAKLSQVHNIHVVGITSNDVGLAHAGENYWQPLRSGKLHYWTIGIDTTWAKWLGLDQQMHRFADADTMVKQFSRVMQSSAYPVYLSIDKDVLAPDIARTNWDQGCLRVEHLEALIAALSGRIVGSDITGDISLYQYGTPWKRGLSWLDRQPIIETVRIVEWQHQQAAINQRLLACIARYST